MTLSWGSCGCARNLTVSFISIWICIMGMVRQSKGCKQQNCRLREGWEKSRPVCTAGFYLLQQPWLWLLLVQLSSLNPFLPCPALETCPVLLFRPLLMVWAEVLYLNQQIIYLSLPFWQSSC